MSECVKLKSTYRKIFEKGARIIIQVAQLHAIAGRNMGMVLCGS
ncbi:hypothetical protein [Nostoc sp.]